MFTFNIHGLWMQKRRQFLATHGDDILGDKWLDFDSLLLDKPVFLIAGQRQSQHITLKLLLVWSLVHCSHLKLPFE